MCVVVVGDDVSGICNIVVNLFLVIISLPAGDGKS
jgi:hypothetical protein